MEKIALNYDTLIIDGADLIFKNFSGRETAFNRLGERNFGVIIDDNNWAQALQLIGWNVKKTSDGVYFLSVSVRLPSNPPEPTVTVTHKYSDRTVQKSYKVDGSEIGALDNMRLTNCALKIHGYHYEINGRSGIKAHLTSLCAERESVKDVSYLVYDKDEWYENRTYYSDVYVVGKTRQLEAAIEFAREYVSDWCGDTHEDMDEDREYFKQFTIDVRDDISDEEFIDGEYIQYYLRKKPRNKRFEHRSSIMIKKHVFEC